MRMIHVLRKPLSEKTVAANTVKHGTGGLNIDASRVGAESRSYRGSGVSQMRYTDGRAGLTDGRGRDMEFSVSGRWPANVILQHLDGCRCDGVKRVKAISGGASSGDNAFGQDSGWNAHQNRPTNITRQGDKDGKEPVANWVCEPGCPVARLDEQSGVTTSTGGRIGNAQGIYTNQGRTGWGTGHEAGDPGFGDTGGASRFYKQVGGVGETT